MGKDNTILIIGGIAVVGIVGYFLYKYISGGGDGNALTIHFLRNNSTDIQVGESLVTKLNPTHVLNLPYSNFPAQIYQDTLLIGGEQANPSSVGLLVNAGLIPPLTQVAGTWRIDKIIYYIGTKNYNVWVVRGWNPTDTLTAGQYILDHGLPTNTVTN